MIRPFRFVLLLAALASAGPAVAGISPGRHMVGRAELAQSCAALGSAGKGWGLTAATGPYGCQNLGNGNAVTCDQAGQCRDYFGDPRWRRIHDLIGGAPARRMLPPQPL